MNEHERIQQLAEQCTSIPNHLNPPVFDREKFAKLIVQECGAVALNIGCGDIEDELLKHFGVEE